MQNEEDEDEQGISLRRKIGFLLGPACLVAALMIGAPGDLSTAAWWTLGLAFFMAVWWITEAVPVAATALLPIPLIPLLGLGSIDEAASPYASPVIFLFLGGFLIAQAVQRWNLHRRIALYLIRLIGTSPRRIIAGFMLATALLSMWISNTATAVMMLPIGLSLVHLITEHLEEEEDPKTLNFAVALLLGIAYSSSIGGAATIIGTPPNALLVGYIDQEFGVNIGFGQWMVVGIPFVILMLPVAWFLVVRVIFPVKLQEIPGGRELIDEEIGKLGPITRAEKVVSAVFLMTALAWVSRPFLEDLIPGLTDAGIAIMAAIVLFLLPVHPAKGEFALDWESARELPWRVLVLFGGGLSLANMITRHGLAQWLGESMTVVALLPVIIVLIVTTTTIIIITQLTTNTAAAATFFPVLAALAISIGEHPFFLLISAAIGASCAFILPVATPPNAIMYGSGLVQIRQMARSGILLNLLFAIAIPLIVYFIITTVFGLEPGVLPTWAR